MKKVVLISCLICFLAACGGSKSVGKYDKPNKKGKVSQKYSAQNGDRNSLEDVLYSSLGHKRGSGVYYSRSGLQDGKFDIPMVYNERVQKWIDYFTGRGSESFARYLARSGRFVPYIHAVLKQYGLPKDIVYLSMIESGFNTRAASWASAVGPWQFIRSTGGLYGLEADYYLDERRDVEKSTHAAVRHLKDLYDEFGDWYLAFAAYNAGAGKIRNAISRHGPDFWDMADGSYLRQETKDYVPKILAAAIISKNPRKYGFDHVEYQMPIDYEKIRVASPVDLEVAGECAGVSPDLIRLLNSELLRDMTPPNIPNYELKIPRGTKVRFQRRYASLSPAQRMKSLEITIDKHDSLTSIASRYGVSQRELFAANAGKIDSYRTKETRKVAVRGKRGKIKYKKETYSVAHYRVSPGTRLTIPKNRSMDAGASLRDDRVAHSAKREFGIDVARLDEESRAASSKKDKKNKKKQEQPRNLAQLVETHRDTPVGSDLAEAPAREDLVATASGKSDLDPSLYDNRGDRVSTTVPREENRGSISTGTPLAFSDRPSELAAGSGPVSPSDSQLREAVQKMQPSSDDVALERHSDAAPSEVATEPTADTGEPSVAEVKSDLEEEPTQPTPLSPAPQRVAKPSFHVVKKGETLSGLANRFGVTVADLKAWNGKKVSPFPKTGVKIQVGTTVAAKSGKPASVASKAKSAKAPAKVVRYKVKPGDNLSKIARRHATTPQEIARLNGLKSPKVLPGAILTVQRK